MRACFCVCVRACIYRMRSTVGSMLIFGGLVSLVSRNTAVHIPVRNKSEIHFELKHLKGTLEPVQKAMASCRLPNFPSSSHTLLSNAGSLLLQHGCHGCCCPATVGNQGATEPTQTDGDECKATSFSNRHFTRYMCRYILVPDTGPNARSLNLFPLITQTAPSVMSLSSWKPPDGDCR